MGMCVSVYVSVCVRVYVCIYVCKVEVKVEREDRMIAHHSHVLRTAINDEADV